MCRKSKGPRKLIGSKSYKGGPLQKQKPGEMFMQKKKEELRRWRKR